MSFVKMNILAHKTAMANAPPNSLEGLEHCYKQGVADVECDIVFKDDEPYIWESESIPNNAIKLKDVWPFLKYHPGIRIFFDIKYYDQKGRIPSWPLALGDIQGHFARMPDDIFRKSLMKIIGPARQKGMLDRIGFVTFLGGARFLKTAKEIDASIRTDLIIIFPWTRISKHFEYLDSITVGWKDINHWKLFPCLLRRILRQAHKSGVGVNAGVANSKTEFRWVVGYGFDGMWTDNIIAAKNFLQESIRSQYPNEF